MRLCGAALPLLRPLRFFYFIFVGLCLIIALGTPYFL